MTTKVLSSQITHKNSSASSTSVPVNDKLEETKSVKEFGAKGDGVTNDTTAFTNAGKNTFVPAGEYLVNDPLPLRYADIYGPGEALYRGNTYKIGEASKNAAYGDTGTDHLRHNLWTGEGAITKTTSLTLTQNQAVAASTFTPLTLSLLHDSAGQFFPHLSNSTVFIAPRAVFVTISGTVTFASNTTGNSRSVTIYKNGVFAEQVNMPPNQGLETSVPFSFSLAVAAGDQITISAWHNATASLNVTRGHLIVDVKHQTPAMYPGKRLWVFQGNWATLEAQYGSYEAMMMDVVKYDVLVLSHIERIGTGSENFNFPLNNGILDSNYKHLRRLIYDYKHRKPNGLVFGYVSAAIDAPNWDSYGNPTTNNWAANNYQNFHYWCQLWLRDPHLPLDGFYLDHFASTAITAVHRDNVASIVKNVYNKKLMGNLMAASYLNIQFALACPHLTWGDYVLCEGFYIDNGQYSSGGTSFETLSRNMCTELHKFEARGVFLAAMVEEAATTTLNNASSNNANGKNLFNQYYKPGWCYMYGRLSLDTLGEPGI